MQYSISIFSNNKPTPQGKNIPILSPRGKYKRNQLDKTRRQLEDENDGGRRKRKVAILGENQLENSVNQKIVVLKTEKTQKNVNNHRKNTQTLAVVKFVPHGSIDSGGYKYIPFHSTMDININNYSIIGIVFKYELLCQ